MEIIIIGDRGYRLRKIHSTPHWPMPAVRDLTRDGRWSTYDVSVLKMSNVSFRGKCARMGNTLKIPSPTKLARLCHFPPASQAGRRAGPVFYVNVFFLKRQNDHDQRVLRLEGWPNTAGWQEVRDPAECDFVCDGRPMPTALTYHTTCHGLGLI